MSMAYRIFPTALDLAERVAYDLADKVRVAERDNYPIALALSGGNTPKLLFSVLAEKYHSSLNWNYVDLFWVDERCVSPDDSESNYGMTYQLLLEKIDIPMENIHRMRGENDPGSEADRYAEEIVQNIRIRNGLPVFDIILLGMGEDGHTASLFPHSAGLNEQHRWFIANHAPQQEVWRLTLSKKAINSARNILVLVRGASKARMLKDVLTGPHDPDDKPIQLISPREGRMLWLVDNQAGSQLPPELHA